MNWNDIAERALWTAAQAFLSAFGGAEVFTSWESLQSAAFAGGIAAAAALLALVKNVVRQRVSGNAGV